jgi:hypothetical protein
MTLSQPCSGKSSKLSPQVAPALLTNISICCSFVLMTVANWQIGKYLQTLISQQQSEYIEFYQHWLKVRLAFLLFRLARFHYVL